MSRHLVTKNLIVRFGTSKSIRTQDHMISLAIRLVGCVENVATNLQRKFHGNVRLQDGRVGLLVEEPERVPFRVCK